MTIHPTAVVSPEAALGSDVSIGPFCVVEPGVVIGAGSTLAARATVKAGVRMGRANQVGEGAVIGGLAQHLCPPDEAGTVLIGDRNVFRENTTVHRAMHGGVATTIGDDCLLMVGAHVAHDCMIGSRVILTNNVMLGGHVSVGDRACLGGGAAVHQHCRVGRLAMVGGMARVTQDVPPFVTLDGQTGLVVGLNRIGLRRAGCDRHEVATLKLAYQVVYRSGLSLEERLATLAEGLHGELAAELADFLAGGTRGFVRERRTPPGATLRVVSDDADSAASAPELKRAG